MPYKPGQYLQYISDPMEDLGQMVGIAAKLRSDARSQEQLELSIRADARAQLKMEMDYKFKILEEQRKEREEEFNQAKYNFERLSDLYKESSGARKRHLGDIMYDIAKSVPALGPAVAGRLTEDRTPTEMKRFTYDWENPGPNGMFLGPPPNLADYAEEGTGIVTDNQLAKWSDNMFAWANNDRIRHKYTYGIDKGLPPPQFLYERENIRGGESVNDRYYAVFTDTGIDIKSKYEMTDGNELVKLHNIPFDVFERNNFMIPKGKRIISNGTVETVVEDMLDPFQEVYKTKQYVMKDTSGKPVPPRAQPQWKPDKQTMDDLEILSLASDLSFTGLPNEDYGLPGALKDVDDDVSKIVAADIIARREAARTAGEKALYDRMFRIAQMRDEIIADPQRGWGFSERLFGIRNLKWLSTATSEQAQTAIIKLYSELAKEVSAMRGGNVEYRFVPNFEVHRGKGALGWIKHRLPFTDYFTIEGRHGSDVTLSELGFDVFSQDASGLGMWVAVPGERIAIESKPIVNDKGETTRQFTYYNRHVEEVNGVTVESVYGPLGKRIPYSIEQIQDIFSQYTRAEIYKLSREQQGRFMSPAMTEETMESF